jgi:hypothetical protein
MERKRTVSNYHSHTTGVAEPELSKALIEHLAGAAFKVREGYDHERRVAWSNPLAVVAERGPVFHST